MKAMTTTTILCGLFGLAFATAHAHAAGRVTARNAHANAYGGVTASERTAWRGPAGQSGSTARRVVTDGAGDRSVGRGVSRTGPNGTYRAGERTTVGADGSLQRDGGFRATGARGGSASGSRSFTRNADGSYAGQRSTQADGARGSYDSSTSYANGSGSRATTATAANGNTYQGETSWTRGEGVTHTASCHDAAGNSIACR